MGEILRSPVEVGDVEIPLFARFCTSQAVQDFFHQQSLSIFQTNRKQEWKEMQNKFNRSDRVSVFDILVSDNLSLEGKLYHTKTNRT